MAEQAIEPKPAAAPAPAATPSPAPAAAAPKPAAATGNIPPAPGPVAAAPENPYAELDAAVKKLDTPAPTTQGKDAPKPAAPVAPKTAAAPQQLRDELARVKGELESKSKAISDLEAKIKENESRGKDTEALTTRLQSLEKDLDNLRAENRALKQETSEEFKKKWDEPFNRVARRAESVIEKIQVDDPETGAVRSATWGDFVKVYQLDEFNALRESKRVFGEDGAQIAMGYYRQLKELDDARKGALDEERKQWKEKEAAEQASKIQSREEINKLWHQVNKDLAEKIDDYHDSPDDKELAEARSKAISIYDARAKDLPSKVVKDAHNRQMVGAFAVHKIMLARKDKEIAELKAELDGLKEKPPGPTRRAGGAPAAKPEDDFETGLRKHMAATT